MLKFLVALCVSSALGLALGVTWSAPERRPVETILRELEQIELPRGFLDDEAVKELDRAARARAELGAELLAGYPRHARTADAVEERWAYLTNTFGEHTNVLRETARLLERPPTNALERVALRARAWAAVQSDSEPVERCLEWIDAAVASASDDQWLGALLLALVEERSADAELQRRLCERLVAAPRAGASVKQEARAWLRLLDAVGRAFEIGVDDVSTGQRASLAPHRGQPLMLYVRYDFTWEPLSESELAECERRGASKRLRVVELVIGSPDVPTQRRDRRIVAPASQSLDVWPHALGVRLIPVFFLVDSQGRLAGITHRLSTAEARVLAAL